MTARSELCLPPRGERSDLEEADAVKYTGSIESAQPMSFGRLSNAACALAARWCDTSPLSAVEEDAGRTSPS